MPPFSAGVIPEHTAVRAHQALGQRRAFLPFGKRVGRRVGGGYSQADGTAAATVVEREIKSCADGRKFGREGGRSAEK